VATLLAAPTSLWMVAVAMLAMVPRVTEVLPMILKTLFSNILNTNQSWTQGSAG